MQKFISVKIIELQNEKVNKQICYLFIATILKDAYNFLLGVGRKHRGAVSSKKRKCEFLHPPPLLLFASRSVESQMTIGHCSVNLYKK